MTAILIALLAVLALVIWILLTPGDRSLPPSSYDRFERAMMPAELATARLVMSEKEMRINRPARFVARVDQVFQTKAGQLVLLESKRRKSSRVFDSDVIELSVQSVVLSRRGYRIAPHGYVRTVVRGRPSYHRVRLYSEDVVLMLRERYLDLLGGAVVPEGPRSIAMCRGCAHASRCEVRMVLHEWGEIRNSAS